MHCVVNYSLCENEKAIEKRQEKKVVAREIYNDQLMIDGSNKLNVWGILLFVNHQLYLECTGDPLLTSVFINTASGHSECNC